MYAVFDYHSGTSPLCYGERWRAVRACYFLNKRLPYERYFVRCVDGLSRHPPGTPEAASVEKGCASPQREAFLANARSSSCPVQCEFAFDKFNYG